MSTLSVSDETVVLVMTKRKQPFAKTRSEQQHLLLDSAADSLSRQLSIDVYYLSCHRHEHFLTLELLPDEHHVRRSRRFRGSEERKPLNLTESSSDSSSN